MAEEDKTGRNHLFPGTEGLGWSLLCQRSPGPTPPEGTNDPSAQLSRAVPLPHKLSQGGLGKDAQLWSLALADLTKPPQRLALHLSWTLPRGGDGLWGGYGMARQRRGY